MPISHHLTAPKNWQDLYMIEQADISRALVVARLKNETTDWIQEPLADILEPHGPLQIMIYIVDDEEVLYHPPINKGHEANVYLTYLIDAYNDLSDVVLFMHAHQVTWHNNKLLNDDAALMIRNLDLAKVLEQGYVNLRCHWDPGCPDWIHPMNTAVDEVKAEEHLIAEAWAEIFGPDAAVPETLAQPCCSQFALSREKIRSLPKERYMKLRDWLYETHLEDPVSGRVFKYLWQVIFLASTEYCASQEECYCQQYGVCFDHSRNTYDRGAFLEKEYGGFQDELRRIEEKEEGYHEHCQPIIGLWPIDYNCDERRFALEGRVQFLELEMNRRARAAFDLGRTRRGIYRYCDNLELP